MPQIFTTAPRAGLAADAARRTITGLVVPWGAYATGVDRPDGGVRPGLFGHE